MQAKQDAAKSEERLAEVKAEVATKEAALQHLKREAATEREAMRREVQSISAALRARNPILSTIFCAASPSSSCSSY